MYSYTNGTTYRYGLQDCTVRGSMSAVLEMTWPWPCAFTHNIPGALVLWRNTLRWKPNYETMMMVTVLWFWWLYIYIWWWFMIMIHEYDEHNQCIVCILFFSRDWLSSVVPEFVFSATCWVALYGSPEIKGFTDLNEPFCCHLNRTPSDLARWT